MNPKLPVLLIFMAACISVTAQKKDFGITLAINEGSVAGNGMAAKYQTGFEGGVFAALHITKKISLQPEVLFNLLKINRSNTFGTYYVDGSNPDAATAFNLAYLSVPVLVNYSLSDKIVVNAGPQFNALVYSNENLMYNTKAFKKTDAGIRAGLRFNPSPAVGLFASYYYGVLNINSIDNRYQWKNRQFQIGVNVAIFTGK